VSNRETAPSQSFGKNISYIYIYIHIYKILMPQIIFFKNDSLTYPRVLSKNGCKLLRRKFVSDFLDAALEKVTAPPTPEKMCGHL
jgi:hypothetical protein